MICKKCGKDKDIIDDFGFVGVIKGKKYRRKICKPCRQKQMNLRSKKIRLFIDNYKEQAGCKRCKNKDKRVLDFHHRNPEEKTFTIGDRIRNGLSINNLMKEIEKCDVLCANCHRILHYKEYREVSQR